MSRIVLAIPERPAGWQVSGSLPLLTGPECGAHAALVAAGFVVELRALDSLFDNGGVGSDTLIVLVRPSDAVLQPVEGRLKELGGCVLAIRDGQGEGSRGEHRWVRRIEGTLHPLRFDVSRLSHLCPVRGWRKAISFPSFPTLGSSEHSETVARWGRAGGAALIRRFQGKLSSWTTSFPLDHLDSSAVSSLVQLVSAGGDIRTLHPPVPGGARAVVLLLHDVEEALPGDPRGIGTVREGLEASLRAQAKAGVKATYNLVGSFAARIPDLVQRMVAEGHEVASHGSTHRVVAELNAEGVEKEVEGGEHQIRAVCGIGTRGFRSPRSRWSASLLDLLAARGYLWNAEADPSPFPYQIPRGRPGSLIRIPVAVDDWDYVRHRASPDRMTKLWKKEVRLAVKRGCWVAIGSHPSVLGLWPARMKAFEDFVEWLVREEVAVMTLGAAAEWWSGRAAMKASNPSPAAIPTAKRV